jgi:hypothetical protein
VKQTCPGAGGSIDQLIALRRQNAVAESAAPVGIEGDTPLRRPLRAFDDGAKVFIEFPRAIRQGEMPPLFVLGPEGGAVIVHARTTTWSTGCSPLPSSASAANISRKSASCAPTGDRDGERRPPESRARNRSRSAPASGRAAGDTALPQGPRRRREPRHRCRARRVIWAFDSRRDREEAGPELYNTEHKSTADELAKLPRDYTGVPPGVSPLGPPLPGDLGRPMLQGRGPQGGADPEPARRAGGRGSAHEPAVHLINDGQSNNAGVTGDDAGRNI